MFLTGYFLVLGMIVPECLEAKVDLPVSFGPVVVCEFDNFPDLKPEFEYFVPYSEG